MSLEALWTIRFGKINSPDHDLNGGVAMIETGRVFGGDSIYAYIGTIEANSHNAFGDLRIISHEPDGINMYGRNEDEFDLKFECEIVSNEYLEGLLKRDGYEDARLVLRRLRDLP